MPLARERVGVGDAGRRGQFREVSPDVRQMADRRLMHRMPRIVDLDHCRQECAALEVRLAEPLGEHVEYRQQLLPRSFTAAAALCLEPLTRPQLFPAAQEIENEVVLGREIPVQRHLCRARPRDNSVNPHGLGSIAAEQLIRGTAHPLPPGLAGRGRWFTGVCLVRHRSWQSLPLALGKVYLRGATGQFIDERDCLRQSAGRLEVTKLAPQIRCEVIGLAAECRTGKDRRREEQAG